VFAQPPWSADAFRPASGSILNQQNERRVAVRQEMSFGKWARVPPPQDDLQAMSQWAVGGDAGLKTLRPGSAGAVLTNDTFLSLPALPTDFLASSFEGAEPRAGAVAEVADAASRPSTAGFIRSRPSTANSMARDFPHGNTTSRDL
jgi:hypothetical protein